MKELIHEVLMKYNKDNFDHQYSERLILIKLTFGRINKMTREERKPFVLEAVCKIKTEVSACEMSFYFTLFMLIHGSCQQSFEPLLKFKK